MSAFTWTKQRIDAAQLVADDRLSDDKIAESVGVTRQTIGVWRQTTEFAARVTEIREAYAARVMSRGIANRARRVDALNNRWERMQRVIDARASALGDDDKPSEALVPLNFHEAARAAGFTEGIVALEWKTSPSGNFKPEFSVDTGLLREMRAHEEQTAKELGQWTEKHEHRGEFGIRRYFGVDVEAV